MKVKVGDRTVDLPEKGKRKRAHISLKTKLASMIVTHLKHADENGNLVPIVTHEDAKKLTADQILSLAHFDHVVHHAIEGSDEHWNLVARPILEHRQKTAKVDRPMIAKTRRVTAAHEQHRSRILAKTGQPPVDSCPESVNKARPRPKGGAWPKGRKLQSRPFRGK